MKLSHIVDERRTGKTTKALIEAIKVCESGANKVVAYVALNEHMVHQLMQTIKLAHTVNKNTITLINGSKIIGFTLDSYRKNCQGIKFDLIVWDEIKDLTTDVICSKDCDQIIVISI